MIKAVKNFLGGATSLRRKALTGGGWLMFRSIALGGIDLFRTAVFARVLDANDYGLMALVTMVTGMLTAFTFLGLDVLVQRDGDAALAKLPFYWTIKMIRGILCCVVSMALAEPVAIYYQQPHLALFIRCTSIFFLIEGCSGFGKERCQQTMQFNRLVTAEVLLSVLSLGGGIIAVFIFRDVTALVINQLLTTIVQFALSYLLYPWKPSFAWSGTIVKTVALFSGSIIVLNVFNYFITSFDRATIGKLYNLDTLGFYARGHFLSQIPVMYISMIVAPIFMPAFQKLNSEPERQRRALVKVMLIYSLFFISFGILFAAGARWFVLLVYGERWLPVIPVFRVLLIYGISKSIVSACQPIFFLKNRPWTVTANAGIMSLIFGICCIPLTRRYGIEGTAWSIVAGALFSHLIAVIQAFRLAAIKVPPCGKG